MLTDLSAVYGSAPPIPERGRSPDEDYAESKHNPIRTLLEATPTLDHDEFSDIEIGLASTIRIVISPDPAELYQRTFEAVTAHGIEILAEC